MKNIIAFSFLIESNDSRERGHHWSHIYEQEGEGRWEGPS